MINELNLCFVLDRNYVDKLKVTLYSLFLSNKGNSFVLHIINNDFTKEDKEDLIRFVTDNKNKTKIIYYDYPVDEFKSLVSMHNSFVAYLKVLIPYIIDIKFKLLYLDCDLLVLDNLNNLFNGNTNHFLSAVPDSIVIKKRKEHIAKITGNKENKYFNSGVMLFDNNYLNELNKKEDIFEYIKENKDIIVFHDQDILNHFYINKYNILDYKYNTFSLFKCINPQRNKKEKIVILHYANLKPWNSNYIGKYSRLYKKYYNRIAKKEKLSFRKRSNLFAKIKYIIKHFIKK